MKELRKEKELYICEECGTLHKKINGLLTHVALKHDKKAYFDKWRKEEIDDKCKICNQKTEFISVFLGYKNGCCKEHLNQYVYKTSQEAIFDRYGVENQYQREDVKKKLKKTWFKNYGFDNPSKSEAIKSQKEKTCLKNNGVKYALQSLVFQEKYKQTCLRKYGVEYSHQNRGILDKALKSSRLLKPFANTSLKYQGTYELDFLEKYYNSYPDIKKGFSFRYNYNGKNRVYHSDFYIPSLNLIVEIKSSYILTLDIEIEEKKKSVLNSGYNYIMILDKNYEKMINYEK
jgi:hypothetical protein